MRVFHGDFCAPFTAWGCHDHLSRQRLHFIPASASLAVSDGAGIDLDGGTLTVSGGFYSALGAVTNGTLAVSGNWTPDFADIVAGNSLTAGRLDLSGARLVLTGDDTLLDKSNRYVLATATDAVIGQPPPVDGAPKRPQNSVLWYNLRR